MPELREPIHPIPELEELRLKLFNPDYHAKGLPATRTVEHERTNIRHCMEVLDEAAEMLKEANRRIAWAQNLLPELHRRVDEWEAAEARILPTLTQIQQLDT
ncbi:hypothetical protein [Deinococcus cellulosilyticus]|uniref:Uncharacterized protein n=1 Tax=Deinococcus cellulosilyticus (strain DSM 18568 / NBRC 106333 / KACC 11606 / 5516J-15) TaxID=1223518 RepID=A0A511N034_DEIC1|nr:hypothetical protein [Deinococcus cellulosilyticus]GEM45881.1 hypothetical protein DC3_15160 [Deinococcus cellulosilyticus NBRC 106333 = KACC 11606]